MFLCLAHVLRDIRRGVDIPSECQGALPMRVYPLAILDVEFTVVYTCASDCERSVGVLLKSRDRAIPLNPSCAVRGRGTYGHRNFGT